jgi:OCT family organic cation transporter-like MFS transporter 4/5
MLGVLIGAYVFGEMSDKIGRKPTLVAAIAIQVGNNIS